MDDAMREAFDFLLERRDPFLFGPPVYLGDDEELIRRSRQ